MSPKSHSLHKAFSFLVRHVPRPFILFLLELIELLPLFAPPPPEIIAEWRRTLGIGLERSFHWLLIPPALPLHFNQCGNTAAKVLFLNRKLGHATFLKRFSGLFPIVLSIKFKFLDGIRTVSPNLASVRPSDYITSLLIARLQAPGLSVVWTHWAFSSLTAWPKLLAKWGSKRELVQPIVVLCWACFHLSTDKDVLLDQTLVRILGALLTNTAQF